jgi:xylose isomerase
MSVLIGNKEYFKGIEQVQYEGTNSDNPLAFRWYDKEKVVAGKTMKFYKICADRINGGNGGLIIGKG